MTYRELWAKLIDLNDEQLDMELTVESEYDDECHPAEFRICGPNHAILDEGHPVIFFL